MVANGEITPLSPLQHHTFVFTAPGSAPLLPATTARNGFISLVAAELKAAAPGDVSNVKLGIIGASNTVYFGPSGLTYSAGAGAGGLWSPVLVQIMVPLNDALSVVVVDPDGHLAVGNPLKVLISTMVI